MKARTLLPLLLIASLTACSSSNDSNGDTTGGDTGTDTGDTGGDTGSDTGGDTGGGTGGDNVDGGISGVWFGNNGFGEAVVVIEPDNDIYSYSAGSGVYEAAFGSVGSAASRFIHRDSENSAHGDSFTLVGDVPSAITTFEAGADSVTYNLAVTNDGQQLDNTGDAGSFSLTFAGSDDVSAISVADIAGTWVARTSFSATDNLVLSMTIAADGAVSGFTDYASGSIPDGVDGIALTGTVGTAADSSLYLPIQYNWNDFDREGVLFFNRTNSQLVLNGFGAEGDANNFTALLTRQ